MSYILAIAAGIVAMGGLGSYVIHENRQAALNLWKSELSTSVRYQTWTLRVSLQQSEADAEVLAEFPATKEVLAGIMNTGARSTRLTDLHKQVLKQFDEYRKIYKYDALYLFDAEGQVAVETADSVPASTLAGNAKFRKTLASVVLNRHLAVELWDGVQKELSLAFIMPIFAGEATDDRAESVRHCLMGVVVVVDSFAQDLLPLLTANRVVTLTGENVLLQMKAGEGYYASPRRYASGLTRRMLENDTLRRASSSAVETSAVFGQFVDYRGVDVLAAMEKIENINCVLICKVDKKEALAEFRRVVYIETVTALSILLAYIGLVVMHNRAALARQTRESLARQQFANQRLETTVADRTKQLAEVNHQLHRELGERELAEEEVRKLNAALDQRVRERTAELESANKDLEAFSYSISHDLRAPLRRMRGFSTILLEEHAARLPQEAQRLLHVVNTNAVQMGQLITCLLDLSQLGRKQLCKKQVVPSDIALLAWQDLSAEHENRKVEFALGELGVCEADPLLLKQVYINLFSNALKYSRTRETSTIDVGCMDTGIYYVRDNGVGFDMRFGQNLFGVFKRLHRADEYEGIGIGLAIVARIVQRHGGRVWADAVVNQGACFYFTLGLDVDGTTSGSKRFQ